MVQTQLSFKHSPRMLKARNYRDVQKSVNLLFSILEEYRRLEKNWSQIKNKDSSLGY